MVVVIRNFLWPLDLGNGWEIQLVGLEIEPSCLVDTIQTLIESDWVTSGESELLEECCET